LPTNQTTKVATTATSSVIMSLLKGDHSERILQWFRLSGSQTVTLSAAPKKR